MRKQDYKYVANAQLMKKVNRRRLADEYGLCDYCPLHSGENTPKSPNKYPIKKAFQLRRNGKRVKRFKRSDSLFGRWDAL